MTEETKVSVFECPEPDCTMPKLGRAGACGVCSDLWPRLKAAEAEVEHLRKEGEGWKFCYSSAWGYMKHEFRELWPVLEEILPTFSGGCIETEDQIRALLNERKRDKAEVERLRGSLVIALKHLDPETSEGVMASIPLEPGDMDNA